MRPSFDGCAHANQSIDDFRRMRRRPDRRRRCLERRQPRFDPIHNSAGWVIRIHRTDGWNRSESIGIDPNRSVERGRGRESKTYVPREGWWFEQWWRTLSCVSVCVSVVNQSQIGTGTSPQSLFQRNETKRNEDSDSDRDFDETKKNETNARRRTGVRFLGYGMYYVLWMYLYIFKCILVIVYGVFIVYVYFI